MSVVLYEDERFIKIYQSIRNKGRDLACVFAYPDGWDKNNGMDKTLQVFVRNLRNANIEAWNNRYEEENEPGVEELDFTNHHSYMSIYDLIKSLKGVSYNMVESESFENVKQTLFKVIYFLMSRVLDEIPAYQNSKAW